MRLTSQQINDIQTAAREVFSSAVNVRLFGSRLDDQRRGGDIDLLVEPAHTLDAKDLVEKRSRFIAKLYRLIGEQHIDVLVALADKEDDRLIVTKARKDGQFILKGIA